MLSPLSIISLFVVFRGVTFTALVLINIVTLVIGWVYVVLMTARFGQTLGKMATGVKITNWDGSTIGFGEAWWRCLAKSFGGLAVTAGIFAALAGEDVINFEAMAHIPRWINGINSLWVLAQLITVLSNDRRRAIHDYLSGTQVVIKDRAESQSMTPVSPTQ